MSLLLVSLFFLFTEIIVLHMFQRHGHKSGAVDSLVLNPSSPTLLSSSWTRGLQLSALNDPDRRLLDSTVRHLLILNATETAAAVSSLHEVSCSLAIPLRSGGLFE